MIFYINTFRQTNQVKLHFYHLNATRFLFILLEWFSCLFLIWFADNILYIQLSIMIFCLKYSIITSECSWKRSNGVDCRRTRSVGRRCWLSWLLIILSYLCQNYERFYFYNKNFSLRKEYSIILFVFYSFWSTFLHGCSLLLINKTCCHFPSSWLLGNFVERFSFQILIKSRFFMCITQAFSRRFLWIPAMKELFWVSMQLRMLYILFFFSLKQIDATFHSRNSPV